MYKFLFITLIIIVTGLLLGCQRKTTEPPGPESFTPLSVGDKTQIVFMLDSSTTSLEIVDKVERADGQTVYKGLYKNGTQIPDELYYRVSNGFLVATELDTVRSIYIDVKVNPFREQRLAKSFPESGDTWVHTAGDSLSAYFIAEKTDSFNPLWGEVGDVFKFDLYDKYETVSFLSVYYGRGLGWIGSSTPLGDVEVLEFICSYKFVSGEFYGELWPEKDVGPFFKNKKHSSISALLNHLTGNIPYSISGEQIRN